jgi:predicted kinase
MEARAGDRAEVSDADFAVYLKAKASFEPPTDALPPDLDRLTVNLLELDKPLTGK